MTNTGNIFLKPEHSDMLTKEELKKHLKTERVYAMLIKVTGKGIHYYAQLIYPGRKDLLAVYFLVPLKDIKSSSFEATIDAKRLVDYIDYQVQ